MTDTRTVTQRPLSDAERAVFDEWFGPASDGVSEAIRRAIRDGLAAATPEEPRGEPDPLRAAWDESITNEAMAIVQVRSYDRSHPASGGLRDRLDALYAAFDAVTDVASARLRAALDHSKDEEEASPKKPERRPYYQDDAAVTPKGSKAMLLTLVYLAAIVAANLSVSMLGPSAVIANAFLLIGLDLTVRDRLHDAWSHDQLALRMGLLVAAGGALTYLINRDAGPIALASTVAFTAAAICDAAVYSQLHRRPRLVRVNGSNLIGAAVDSVLFPTLAFGSLLPLVVLGQFAAKVAGGFIWSLILAWRPRRWVAR